MKILLAALAHETHCFIPEITGADRFLTLRGEAILGRAGDGSTIDGFLEVAQRQGWTVIPTAAASAMSSGRVADAVFEAFWREVEAVARPAIAEGIDAIYLVLHGAMVTETIEDPEGELIERLRALPGAAALPIFGVFDLHGTFTARMAGLANCLVAYRENPHIDARDAAVLAAELLARSLATGRLPRMYRVKPPIILPPAGTATADSPMADLEDAAREIEAASPDIWAVNIAAGYGFADVPEAGLSLSLVSVGSETEARAALDRLHALAMSLKERGFVLPPPVDDVLRQICPVGQGPVVLVEPSDDIGGGAPGDGTGILRALLRHEVGNAAVVINDPEAIAALSEVPVGGVATVAIGGKKTMLDEGPVTLAVTLLSRSDGRFTLEDRNSHLAAMRGIHIDMGPSAVVEAKGITILLTTNKTPPFDLGQLRSQGIEPTTLSIIGVKAGVGHRRAYDPIAAGSYTVLTPGTNISDLRTLPYRRIHRPIFPLDTLPR
jgi:microcystin degradation protein MlrC